MRVKGTLDVKASVKLGSLHMQASGDLSTVRPVVQTEL